MRLIKPASRATNKLYIIFCVIILLCALLIGATISMQDSIYKIEIKKIKKENFKMIDFTKNELKEIRELVDAQLLSVFFGDPTGIDLSMEDPSNFDLGTIEVLRLQTILMKIEKKLEDSQTEPQK